MKEIYKNALEYIKNTGGFPLVRYFIEDHEPIGEKLINDLIISGFIGISKDEEGRRFIYATNENENIIFDLTIPIKKAPLYKN